MWFPGSAAAAGSLSLQTVCCCSLLLFWRIDFNPKLRRCETATGCSFSSPHLSAFRFLPVMMSLLPHQCSDQLSPRLLSLTSWPTCCSWEEFPVVLDSLFQTSSAFILCGFWIKATLKFLLLNPLFRLYILPSLTKTKLGRITVLK